VSVPHTMTSPLNGIYPRSAGMHEVDALLN
jgi:hypothetical protein